MSKFLNLHLRYSSIDNHYKQDIIETIQEYNKNASFFIQEKVHGSNLQFIIDFNLEPAIYTGSRNQFLNVKGEIYNSNYIKEKLKLFLYSVVSILKQDQPNFIEQVIFYGEIFGGTFLNKTNSKYCVIQKGVEYSFKNHFYLFDICINRQYFLDYSTIEFLFNKCKDCVEDDTLLLAKNLYTGTFDQCLQTSNQWIEDSITSYIAPMLNPGVEENLLKDNIPEGFVIKPFEKSQLKYRPIIKVKHPNFFEKKKIKYNPSKTLSKEANNTLLQIKECITKNRIDSVKSKQFYNLKDNKDCTILVNHILLDIYKELSINANEWTKEKKKLIEKLARTDIWKILKIIR